MTCKGGTMSLSSIERNSLLTSLPNETLFSISSRLHVFWGHHLASKTSLQLFGKVRGGYHHDLPNCVNAFCERTKNFYGNPTEICLEKTLLRFYKHFISSSEVAQAVDVMSGTKVSHLKLRLGILTSRFRANHPLKACPSCIRKDIETVGCSFWHIEHQYPGVWYCNVHGELLGESEVKSNGVDRFQWVLPNLRSLRIPFVEINAAPQIAGLSRFIADLVDTRSTIAIDFTHIYLIYRQALEEAGYKIGKRFRFIDITSSFQRYVKSFCGIDEFNSVLKADTVVRNQLQSLLRLPRVKLHPLRHLLIMHWLFGTYENFLDHYTNGVPNPLNSIVLALEKKENRVCKGNDEKRQKFNSLVDQLQKNAISIRAAANQIGIDTATAMVWATRAGITISRRPKKLSEEIRQNIIEKLHVGYSKKNIADEFGVSIVTVTQILRTEVGLYQSWRDACFGAKQTSVRKVWIELLNSHANFGVNVMRALSPSTYAWLYRNDRDWLLINAPGKILTTLRSKSSVNWDERDLILSQAIEQAARQVQSSLGKRKIMMWHLYQKVPELKAKMARLEKLPLTSQVLSRILGKNIELKKSGSQISI